MSAKNSDSLFLGWGNEWSHKEAQLIYDLTKRDINSVVGKSKVQKGAGYIHGLLEQELPVRFPFALANGHVLITGASGSGKTRFFDLILKQLILRNETVIFLDPKGDKEVREIAKSTCVAMGQPDRYCLWHPAYPRESIRLNPLKNFGRTSEVASRVVALMGDDGDAFYRDLATTVVQFIVDSLMLMRKAINLENIKHYYEQFDKLIEDVCIAWFDLNNIEWQKSIYTKIESTNDASLRATICAEYYKNAVVDRYPNQNITGCISFWETKQRLLEQSTGSLLANLVKVTNGILSEMLSPIDDDDPRPSFDMKNIIRSNKVFLIGTDSMADQITSSAIGKMILSDAVAVAADRYNYGDGEEHIVNIIVDEASEMLCNPLISMVNKARGSKFRLWIATQTISDLTAELGSEAKADQIIASTNNFISFRCADTATQERVCAKVPETRVRYVMRTASYNASDADVDGLGAGVGERLMEEPVPMFPMELMGQLPDLEYVASLAGGKLIKGRLPILT
ncbi:conjugative transfer system coupling protein TraD [Photobacterium leiognathi]|uniref:conjugative transfer system coupling protein TraD n=1 Tax=Photobacterium leiognathi TaxID=553611 RepID=UPI002738C140|nr:conjugative transfer system coupling protein TraD [Photobacterium leiognathi]